MLLDLPMHWRVRPWSVLCVEDLRSSVALPMGQSSRWIARITPVLLNLLATAALSVSVVFVQQSLREMCAVPPVHPFATRAAHQIDSVPVKRSWQSNPALNGACPFLIRAMTAAAFLRAESGVSSGYLPSVTRFDRPNARVWATKTFSPEG